MVSTMPNTRAALLLTLAVLASACGPTREYVEPPPPSVEVARPVKQRVTDYLEMTGVTESVMTVEVRARVEGFLHSIEFEEGDSVEEGDLLYLIDPAQYEARARRAEAARDVARANLELREATLERLEQARKSRAVSEIDVIEARAQREVAAAELDSAEAVLRNAKLDLGYTRIVAPTTGRVGRTRVDPGNLVGAGEKTLLTRIVQYDPIYAYFDINERAVLKMMDSADVDRDPSERTLEAIREIKVELGRANDDGYPIEGNLHYVDLDVDAGTGTYLVRAIFKNPEPFALLPGLFVRGRIVADTREDVLLVPDRALGSDQSGKYVLVVDDEDVAQYRQVKTGSLVDRLRVVESGLEADDRVITNGLLQARPGAKVAPETIDLAGNR